MERKIAILYLSLLANIIFAFVIYVTLFQEITHKVLKYGDLTTANSDTKFTRDDSETNSPLSGPKNFTKVKLLHLNDRPSTKPCRQDIFILLMINSAPGNYDRRAAIRNTWGKADTIRGALGSYVWRTIFVVGLTHNENKNAEVNTESITYGDMILADFQEHFRNLTLKTTLGMQWASIYCSVAKYVYKGDDDVMLNPFTLFPKLLFMTNKKLFMGNIMSGSPLIREKNSRYYVSEQDFPSNVYPNYCSGFAYVLSMSVVKAMVAVMPKVHQICIDDAYVGMLAKEVNVPVHWDRGFKPFGPIPTKVCEFNSVIAVHGILPHKQVSMLMDAHKAFLTC